MRMSLSRLGEDAVDSCASGRKHSLRHCAALVFVGFIAVLAACLPEGEPQVNITYENNTDSLLCLYHGTVESPRSLLPGCSAEIEPMKKTTWSHECFSSIEVSAVQVVLIEDSTGDAIYGRTAICREWIDAGSTITIDKDGDRFVVTDGFPEATSGR